MGRLEDKLRTENLSERSRNWLEFANIPAHLMAAQLDPLPVVNIRKIHLYQCDLRGMPVALINKEGQTDWLESGTGSVGRDAVGREPAGP